MRKGDLVRVYWQDIVTCMGEAELSNTISAVHVGVVDKQTTKTLWLKNGWYSDEKEWPAKDGIAIPKGCIDKVEILEVKK